MTTALITGITGQDGCYLAQLLLQRGTRVYGTVRPEPAPVNEWGLRELNIWSYVTLRPLALDDAEAWRRLLEEVRPDEIYHLAGQSSVPESLEHPTSAAQSVALGTAYLLEAMRAQCPRARLLYASSCLAFGDGHHGPLNEEAPLRPQSPYAAAKAYGQNLTGVYRSSFGLHASSAILFNHESPLRPEKFVTRRVSVAAARIKLGLETELRLGNLDAQRDWGYAPDYVDAMARMLQQETPQDYVLATGRLHSLRQLVEVAFDAVGLDPWQYVRTDPTLLRPQDPHAMLGDPARAADQLGWHARTSFEELVRLMVQADLERLG